MRSSHTGQVFSLRLSKDKILPLFSKTSDLPQLVELDQLLLLVALKRQRLKVRTVYILYSLIFIVIQYLTRLFFIIEKAEEEPEEDVEMGDLFGGGDDY